MRKSDAPLDLLADTMKELFPPRVEVERPHYQRLQELSRETGRPVKDLVGEALERYLKEKGAE